MLTELVAPVVLVQFPLDVNSGSLNYSANSMAFLLPNMQLPFTKVDSLSLQERQFIGPKFEHVKHVVSHFQQAFSSRKNVESQLEHVKLLYCKKDLHVSQVFAALPKQVSHDWWQFPYLTNRLLMPYLAGLTKWSSKLMLSVG
jgi:hypothetical protein